MSPISCCDCDTVKRKQLLRINVISVIYKKNVLSCRKETAQCRSRFDATVSCVHTGVHKLLSLLVTFYSWALNRKLHVLCRVHIMAV